MIAYKIERGILLFPETGCELLISQITGFEVEKHDDLMDALTIAVNELSNTEQQGGTMSVGFKLIPGVKHCLKVLVDWRDL